MGTPPLSSEKSGISPWSLLLFLEADWPVAAARLPSMSSGLNTKTPSRRYGVNSCTKCCQRHILDEVVDTRGKRSDRCLPCCRRAKLEEKVSKEADKRLILPSEVEVEDRQRGSSGGLRVSMPSDRALKTEEQPFTPSVISSASPDKSLESEDCKSAVWQRGGATASPQELIVLHIVSSESDWNVEAPEQCSVR